jgi:nitric oxide reductase activation protein
MRRSGIEIEDVAGVLEHSVRDSSGRALTLVASDVGTYTHSEALDIDAAVTPYADQAAGEEAGGRLFTQLQRLEANPAVMILVDMLGSTKGWFNDAHRITRTLLGQQARTRLLITRSDGRSDDQDACRGVYGAQDIC